MEIIKIGIYLKDKAFAKALARGLAKYAHYMEFTVLKSSSDFNAYDLIMGRSDEFVFNVANYVCVSKSRSEADECSNSVYEYEDCQTMINDLLLIYFQMTGKYSCFKQNRLCTTIAGISDSGGAGTTSLIISIISTLYQIYGSKCLYVSLTPLGGHYNYMECKRENNFRYLLYNLQSDKDFPLESFISHYDEMDVIDDGIINYALSDINDETLTRLMSKINEQRLYDYVFLDCGSHITHDNKEIIYNSDIVLLISRMTEKKSCFSEKLYDEFVRMTKNTRMIKINNFDRYCSAENRKDEFFVSEDSGAFLDGRIDLQHNYGTEITAIVKGLVEG